MIFKRLKMFQQVPYGILSYLRSLKAKELESGIVIINYENLNIYNFIGQNMQSSTVATPLKG